MLSGFPSVYETTLDQILVTRLVKAFNRVIAPTVSADVTYIGGKKQYHKSELADILVAFEDSYSGKVKLALLQSKRLYPKKSKATVSRLGIPYRKEEFLSSSTYNALRDKKQQSSIQAISNYTNGSIFYLFYNPWCIPLAALRPYTSFVGTPEAGMRVMPAEEILQNMPKRGVPKYSSIKEIFYKMPQKDKHGYDFEEAGWRFEDWMADLFLGCKVGYGLTRSELDRIVLENLQVKDTPTILLKILKGDTGNNSEG